MQTNKHSLTNTHTHTHNQYNHAGQQGLVKKKFSAKGYDVKSVYEHTEKRLYFTTFAYHFMDFMFVNSSLILHSFLHSLPWNAQRRKMILICSRMKCGFIENRLALYFVLVLFSIALRERELCEGDSVLKQPRKNTIFDEKLLKLSRGKFVLCFLFILLTLTHSKCRRNSELKYNSFFQNVYFHNYWFDIIKCK